MDNRRRMMLATMGGGGIPLSDLPEGSILKILEGGVLIDFYVSKHNYESGLNGAGRTLLVRKDCYDKRAWNSSSVNAYASSAIDSWLNSTYKALLDADIQEAIGTTKFYYTPGNGNTTVGTLSRAIFLLSLTELGLSHSYANVEGSALSIAGTLKIAYLNGSATAQWTRSPGTDYTSDTLLVESYGRVYYTNCTAAFGARPAFTLPADAPCKPNADGNYTLSI